MHSSGVAGKTPTCPIQKWEAGQAVGPGLWWGLACGQAERTPGKAGQPLAWSTELPQVTELHQVL